MSEVHVEVNIVVQIEVHLPHASSPREKQAGPAGFRDLFLLNHHPPQGTHRAHTSFKFQPLTKVDFSP